MNIFVPKVFRENWWTNILVHQLAEAVALLLCWCSVKKVFLKMLQNSQENTCARVYFLIMMQA